jgi:hypothetical protein
MSTIRSSIPRSTQEDAGFQSASDKTSEACSPPLTRLHFTKLLRVHVLGNKSPIPVIWSSCYGLPNCAYILPVKASHYLDRTCFLPYSCNCQDGFGKNWVIQVSFSQFIACCTNNLWESYRKLINVRSFECYQGAASSKSKKGGWTASLTDNTLLSI